MDESEWEAFISCMRSPLPTTFSFVETGDRELRPSIVQPRLESLVMSLGDQQDDERTCMPTSGGGVRVAAGSQTIVRLQVDRSGKVQAFLRVESVAAPREARPLRWFPGGLGWQFDSPRKELVANRSVCRQLRTFLEAHVQTGRVNRQEAVSMLPPLLLQVRPGHLVLDLCAAPGSKTVLLLSQLSTARRDAPGAARAAASYGQTTTEACAHGASLDQRRAATEPATAPPDTAPATAPATVPATAPGGALGEGCVVANEINSMRCNRLRVRMARMRVLGQVLTCHDAQSFPGGPTYDRVLCDVPCSGDGTLRKNPDIWTHWQPRFSASLHPLQLSILRRGLALLKPGGLLVYSTCSLSPVEGEAVVAAALRSEGGVTVTGSSAREDGGGSASSEGGGGSGGTGSTDGRRPLLELLDAHAVLPGFRGEAGLSTWQVTTDEDGSGKTRWEQVTPEQANKWRLTRALFPPDESEREQLGLHRCMRVLPHANDTGGFFIALLRKSETAQVAPATTTATAPATPPPPPPALAADEPELRELLERVAADDDDDEACAGGSGDGGGHEGGAETLATASGAAPPKATRAGTFESEQPLCFTPLAMDSELGSELQRFYELAPSFPWDRLHSTYGHTSSRRLYLTSEAAAELLRRTPGMRVLAAGVKVFERDGSVGVGCGYRLVQEGALLMLPYLGARVLQVTPAEMRALAEARTVEWTADGGADGGVLSAVVSTEVSADAVTEAEAKRGAAVMVGIQAKAAASSPSARNAALVTLGRRLASLHPNGSCVVTCDNGCGSARAAAVLMKYTDKAVAFISNGERSQILDDLEAFYCDPPLAEQLRPLAVAELWRRAGAGSQEPSGVACSSSSSSSSSNSSSSSSSSSSSRGRAGSTSAVLP